VELGDVQIKAGSPVAVCLAAANRDARHFADPERFDVRRAEKGHLTFGFGQHICLGQHVARMELTVAVNKFLDRLPELRLDEAEPAPHLRGFLFRSPRTLPIRWE
jgi:cytochrome P450